jgi:chemotaxis protein CheD
MEGRPIALQRKMRVENNNLRVTRSPHVLETAGIGSCVAIAIYDCVHRLGGLAHISLPAKTDFDPEENLYKYAEIALVSLLGIMESLGGEKRSMVAKIAGGGNMMDFDPDPNYDIGTLNVEAVRGVLKSEGLALVGEDVFGSRSRHLIFDLADGSVTIRTRKRSYAI